VFGEALRKQVEDRLDFFDTGVAPPANAQVMSNVLQLLASSRAAKRSRSEVEGDDDLKDLIEKKKRKSEVKNSLPIEEKPSKKKVKASKDTQAEPDEQEKRTKKDKSEKKEKYEKKDKSDKKEKSDKDPKQSKKSKKTE
jgi:nucleolar protein 56